MDMLDCHKSEEEQAKGRELAKNLRCINVFILPLHKGHNKNVWDNCAMILSERTDEELNPYKYQLLEWLEALNWPGAECMFNRLKEYKAEYLRYAMDESLREAKALNKTAWLENLTELERAINNTK